MDINTLKAYFENGNYPTQTQFAELIDNFNNKLPYNYRIIKCLLKNTGAGWVGYDKLGVGTVTNSTTTITVNYLETFTQVGSLLLTPTIGYAGLYDVGASVGLTNSSIKIAQKNLNLISALITWNGTTFTSNNADVVPTYDNGTGELTLTTSTFTADNDCPKMWHLPNSAVNNTMYSIVYQTDKVVVLKLYSLAGIQKNLLLPQTYRFYFERTNNSFAKTILNPNTLTSATEGIHCIGVMKL